MSISKTVSIVIDASSTKTLLEEAEHFFSAGYVADESREGVLITPAKAETFVYLMTWYTIIVLARGKALAGEPRPIDMLLFCPRCSMQHVDRPDLSIGWTNPSHRSHLCSHCKYVWRPADVPTNGVRSISTCGKNDCSPIPNRSVI